MTEAIDLYSPFVVGILKVSTVLLACVLVVNMLRAALVTHGDED